MKNPSPTLLARWPQLTHRGVILSFHSVETQRKEVPFGVHIHLWRFPQYISACIVDKSISICPGTWAPSINEIIPALFALLHSSSTGSLTAVGEAIWLINRILVFEVTLLQIISTSSSYEGVGIGIDASTHTAPFSTACSCHALLHAPYSWSVASISSPGLNVFLPKAWTTTFTAKVALNTKAIFSG